MCEYVCVCVCVSIPTYAMKEGSYISRLVISKPVIIDNTHAQNTTALNPSITIQHTHTHGHPC